QQVFLTYSSYEIQPAGVVLHGSVLLFGWPAPSVEFEQIPAASGSLTSVATSLDRGPDYSALKTWIPGGRIQQYEWSYQGQPNPFRVDANTFVLLSSGPETLSTMYAATGPVPGYTSLCLTVRGTRLSNFGPVVPEAVSASTCGYARFPLSLGGGAAAKGLAPMLALSRPGPDGKIAVSGHSAAQAPQRG